MVGGDKRVALPFQLTRHLIEKTPQHRNFVIARLFADLHVQVARAHALRRARQSAHGARQTLCEPQTQPGGGQDQDLLSD